MQRLAFYDPLTLLPNRRLFSDRTSQALALSERNSIFGMLLVIDLDNFKALNDNHGHTIGDLLLQETALRIVKSVRETDTVCRYGGDEFVVVIYPLTSDLHDSTMNAQSIARKILLTVSEPFTLQSKHHLDNPVQHSCTVSIGGILFFGNKTLEDQLFFEADKAMYRSKELGRNQIRFANPIFEEQIKSA